MRPPPLEDVRDRIRLRVNLVEVVQQHVRLRKQGREYVGLCPFHQERTASFSVNEQKQSWYCFGCQRGGDVFAFVALIEKTDFAGALRILAEMAGVDLPERGRAGGERRAELRRRILDLNRLAAQYYEYVLHALPAGEPGRSLLERRRVDEATARRFGLGYAPGGASLAAFLRSRGRSLEEAQAAGLVRNGRDYFQRRLVVPIRDERGQPVAFTGRTVLADEPRKYVNSPETPVYVKGRVLFGLDLARTEIEARGRAVLVEGQFDVISAHQHGLTNAVASSGTALTADQLRLLRRFTEEVVLLFDNDRAGRIAAERAVGLAQEEGLRVRMARIPGQAKDPDEFFRAGGDWEALLRDAQPGWETMIRDRIEGLNSRAPGDRELGVRRIREVLGQIQDPAEKDTYAEFAGRLFDIDPRLLLAREPVPSRGRRPAGPPPESVPSDRLTPSVPGNKLSKSVGYLLQVLAVRPEALGRVQGGLDPETLEGDDRAAYLRVVSALERSGVEGLEGELEHLPAELQNLVRRAWAAPPPETGDQVVDELVARLRQESLRRRRREIIRGLEEAERRQDHARAQALAMELKRLRERG
jgi:DNA primase